MNPNVRSMLEDIYGAFKKKFQNPGKSWDYFIDFLAGDNYAPLILQFNHKFEWLFQEKDITKAILEHYDPLLLESDYHDHLGDMYMEHFPGKSNGHIANSAFMTKNIEELLKDSIKEKQAQPRSILDAHAGTGRFLMYIHQSLPNCRLFGIESNLRIMRIALINMAIHEIPVCLLHADIAKHAYDIANEDGYYNWQYANNWYSCMDKLKPLNNH